MAERMNIGILGIGSYLPKEVRTNDWWPDDVVAKWSGKQVWEDGTEGPTPSSLSAGARLTLQALQKIGDDPFQGAVSRHIMGEDEKAADMEAAAAVQALKHAGVEKEDIGFLLSYTMTPDYINAPNACIVHHHLGLRPDCLALATDAVCNSFQEQLALAHSLCERNGKYGLLVQSSAITRVTPFDRPFSASFGDGATAVVVGPVPASHGVLAQAHYTDGSLHRGLVCTVPGKNWWDDGRIFATPLDKAASRRTFLQLADRAKIAIDDALGRAHVGPEEVDFFASHQATVWLRPVTQELAGLHNAASVDTFSWAGTLSAANIPMVLSVAERDGLLHEGDLVCMHSGGTGITWSSTVMRWGHA